MATTTIQSTIDQSKNAFKTALKANGAFCEISGILTILAAPAIAETIGAGSPVLYRVIGVLTLLHGLLLFISGMQKNPHKFIGWYMQAGDILWVAVSAVIVFADPFDITTSGKWLVAIVADIVLLFAIAQFFILRKLS